MKEHAPDERTAAFPLLIFVLGLAAARIAVNLQEAIAGTIVIALLVFWVTHRARPVVLVLFLAGGLTTGAHAVRSDARTDAVISGHPVDRFATVIIPIDDSWHRTATGFHLSASRFFVDGVTIPKRITVYLATQPPEITGEASVVAEGFLRRRADQRYTLTCKSTRLVRYRDTAPRLHPRYWNRVAERKLSALAHRRRQYEREVALAKALALGRSGDLPSDLREDYRRGGTYHLLVFSGMQIAAAAATITFLFRRRGALRSADWALLLLSLFAPLFAGNEPSVTRASIMIALYSLSRLLNRPTSLENLFFVSALVRLATTPHDLTDPGFALTYAATGGLLFIGRPLAQLARSRLAASLLYGFGADVATIPLTLFFFHQYVLGGSLVTILLAPILAVMLALSALACVLALISVEATSMALQLLGVLDAVATAINHFFGETIGLARMAMAPPVALLIFCYVAFMVLTASRARVRAVALILVIPWMYSLLMPLRLGEVRRPEISFLDVGQGDAILLRAGRHAVLIDGGGRRDDPEFGRRVLLPKLLDRGIRSLDAVLLTHPHPDHCGSLATVFRAMDVGELWIASQHLREPCANKVANLAFDRRLPVHLIRGEEQRRIGELSLELFAAGGPFKRAALNNESIVCRVNVSGRRILLTGDIEREAEIELLEKHFHHLSADVLKIAHHGSRNSTSPPFISAVSPRIAVISSGQRNPFGHPHDDVLQRLRTAGIRAWRTDWHGDVRIVIQVTRVFVLPQIDTPPGEP